MTQSLAPWQHDSIICHSQRLVRSFQHWTKTPLIEQEEGDPAAIAQALFIAPIVVVSHGTEADPILNYGNQRALELWEMDWQSFSQTPSRLTAEPIEQTERAQFLKQAVSRGMINDYQGIRISSSGKRFWIQNVVIWDVLDDAGDRCGQAATFAKWTYL